MAKEVVFKFKVEVDGKEVEQTVSSIDGFQKRISDLQTKLNSAPLGSKQFQDLQKELKKTEGAFDAAKSKNQSFLDNLSEAPGLLGTFGQSIQGVSKVFSSFNNVLKFSFFGIIATLITKVVEKLSQMEGVLDPLTKISEIFSTVLGKLANVVMKPLAFIIEGVALGFEKLGNILGKLTGDGETYGETLGKISEGLDELEDSQASFELQLQKSNRALAEAREVAADQTKSVEERKKALQDADTVERDLAKQNRERTLQRGRLQAQQLAAELGFNEERIKAIANYDARALESFTQEVTNFKGLNRDKLNTLIGYIGQVEEISAQEAKIGKKTASAIKAVDNEEKQRKEALAKDAEQKAKERRQSQIADYDAQIKLLTGFQDQTKKKDDEYYADLENKLREFYRKRNELEDKDNKLTASQREVRKKEQEKAIKDAIKADKDAVTQQVQQRQEAYKKLLSEVDKFLEEERKKIQTQRDISQKQELQQLKRNFVDKKITEEQYNNEVLLNNKKYAEQRLKDEQDAYNKEKAALVFALLAKKIDRETFEKQIQQLTTDYQTQLANSQIAFGDTQIAIDESNAARRAQIAENSKKLLIQIEEAQAKSIIEQRLAVANAIGFVGSLLSQFAGKSKALAIAGILIQQGAAISQILTQSAAAVVSAQKNAISIPALVPPGIPNPAFFVAQANLAREIATIKINKVVGIASAVAGAAQGIAQINSAQTEGASAGGQEPRQLASGGVVSGPGTATSDSIPAMLSNGESVINANSTAMFGPLLSAINQIGGGAAFQFGGVVSGAQMSLDQQNQSLISAITQQDQSPIKTYVVSSDMTSQQMFDIAQKSRSTL